MKEVDIIYKLWTHTELEPDEEEYCIEIEQEKLKHDVEEIIEVDF